MVRDRNVFGYVLRDLASPDIVVAVRDDALEKMIKLM